MLATISGVIVPQAAFLGLGHPATITIAAVLIISRALTNSGVVEIATSLVRIALPNPTIHIAALAGLGALLSTIMNNVGALALLMPVALQSSLEANQRVIVIFCRV